MSTIFEEEFFPTPDYVIGKMVEPYDDLKNRHILEPSAGDGAILDFIKKRLEIYRTNKFNMFCIEKNKDLQFVLQGKGYRLLCEDFLTFNPIHDFDLIVMNPPFSNGDEHLLKAWEIIKKGKGDVVCLLNAETIRNPHTMRRQLLAKIIEQNGSVEFIGRPFATASRKTNVEVALVRLHSENENDRWKIDFSDNSNEDMPDFSMFTQNSNEIAKNDKIGSYLHAWDKAREACVDFIKARRKLDFYASAFIGIGEIEKIVSQQMTSYKSDNGDKSMISAYNCFIEETKLKAWSSIINQLGMQKYMTKSLRDNFYKFCEQQGAYELTRENIINLVNFVCMNMNTIMDKAVVDLYDNFTKFYEGNTNHTEGWKTNSAYKVNKKVILPGFVRHDYSSTYRLTYYRDVELYDIDRVMCYLSGCNFDDLSQYHDYKKQVRIEQKGLRYTIESIAVGDQSWHESKFFRVKCFKKGTLHIEFKDEKLWERFNLVVSEGKKVLGY